MTKNLLPETDRLATEVNPLLTEIAALDDKAAGYVEIGAVTVIGLLGESVTDLRTQYRNEALAVGIPVNSVDDSFNTVFVALADILQPRLDAMRDACGEAKNAAMIAELDGLIAGLLTSLIGEEAAAEFIASLEADEAETEDEDEDDEDYWDLDDDYYDEYEDEDEETETETETVTVADMDAFFNQMLHSVLVR